MPYNYEIFTSQARIKAENHDLITGHEFMAIIFLHQIDINLYNECERNMAYWVPIKDDLFTVKHLYNNH